MKYLLPCVALLLPAVGRAQSTPHARLGLTAGGALTTIVGPGTRGAPATEALAGVVGGVVAQLPLNTKGHLFLQPELVYDQQGYRLTNAGTNYEARLRADYVSLPLLLGFTTHGFFAMAGPQVSYLAGVRNRYQFNEYSTTGMLLGRGENSDTDSRSYQRWQASLTGAVGYRMPNGLGLEVRYSEALHSARVNNITTDSYRPRNVGGQVRLSYLFH